MDEWSQKEENAGSRMFPSISHGGDENRMVEGYSKVIKFYPFMSCRIAYSVTISER